MSTYFETVKRSFVDVPTEPGVDTIQFLEATEGLIKMFDLLGNPSFTVVQSDMNGNVKKIRDRFLATPDRSATLESLMENEKGEKKKTATEGLLWLIRGLKFTQVALKRSRQNKQEELADSFSEAYAVTLKKYHSFVIKPIFALAMKACPYRATFYSKLGPPEADIDGELEKWLAALEKIIAQVEAAFERGQYTKGM
ncbi:hypothetical protein OIV83_001456 [Microbotryomycetes sp. JL201]|nr:hypothetical protein OIV83_001456 [Microbotryomycetes sp. JL201]